MAVTQELIDALDLAIISGHRIVRYQDAEVTYQTIEEMLKARAHAQAMLSGNGGIRGYFATYSSGLSNSSSSIEGEEHWRGSCRC